MQYTLSFLMFNDDFTKKLVNKSFKTIKAMNNFIKKMEKDVKFIQVLEKNIER